MGWRFRRSIKILPGVKLNISKKSTSISIGGRGATVNFNKHGTKTTVGIPGTGLSYTNYEKKERRNQNVVSSTPCHNYTLKDYIFYIILVVIIFSLGAYIITSCKNNHKEKIIAEKIKEEVCDPVTTEIDWCRNAKTVSLRGVGLLVDDNFKKFMKIRPGNYDYTGLSGIKIIKSKTNPKVKYARVFGIEKDFHLVPGTEMTLIMDGDFNAIEVVNGNLFKN